MAEHPNVELWRKASDAFSRGDMDAVRGFWSDDVVYHFSGSSVLAGDHKGKDGVLAFFGKVAELTAGTFRIVGVHAVLANDDHVVALLHLTASRQGRELSWNDVNVYHVDDGRITEAWIHSTDQRAVDELLS